MDPQRFNPVTQIPGPSTLQTGDQNQPQQQMDINRAVTGNSNQKMDRINIYGELNPKMQQKQNQINKKYDLLEQSELI